jgi:hypothetical protein
MIVKNRFACLHCFFFIIIVIIIIIIITTTTTITIVSVIVIVVVIVILQTFVTDNSGFQDVGRPKLIAA